MRCVITGDVQRPGQQDNILRLYAVLGSLLAEAFGTWPELQAGEPLEHEAWMQAYEAGPYPVMTDDLVIGFELPPCARRTLPRWIDLRVHPVRFLDFRGPTAWNLFGLRSNVPGVEEAAARFAVEVRRPKFDPVPGLRGAGVFTCQVQHDASLLRDGRFIAPADVWPALVEWAARFPRVLVCPHPAEPEGPWPKTLLRDLPHAVAAPVPTYQALASVDAMCTVSSSTGVEAYYFNCEPTFLYRAPDAPPPVRLETPGLWHDIAAAIRRNELHNASTDVR